MKISALFLGILSLSLAACGSTKLSALDSGQPASCMTDDACPTGQHCENNVCAQGSGNQCMVDGDCPMGQMCKVVSCDGGRCHGNTCVPKTATCMKDSNCMAPDICVKSMCAPPAACRHPSDCAMGLQCNGGICRDPCTQDADCGQRFLWHCDTMSGQCEQVCNNDNVCPGETICEMFRCIPSQCDTNMDCKMGTNPQCMGGDQGHGRCINITTCDAMGNCPPNTTCNHMTNQCEMLPACVSDRDCMNNTYCQNNFCQPSTGCSMAMPCPMNQDCVGGLCVPFVCRGDADCTTMGQRCIGGMCQAPPAITAVTSVRIISPAGVVRPGTNYAFAAVALDQAGRVVPGVSFMWTSSMTSIATITQGGVATGAQTAGVTMITASLMNGANLITSPPVSLRNLGPIAAQTGVRVSVVDLASGAPVPSATVVFAPQGSPAVTQMTDASGVVNFAGPAPASYSVTAAEPNHDFVSVLDLSAPDILITLPPVSKPTVVGGIKGNVDFSHITAMGALSLSLSGASMPSPLVTFDPATLFGGDIFTVSVQNPQGGGNLHIPVPAGTTLAANIGGFNLNLKDTYYARASSGVRAAWSFAGRLDFGAFGGGGGGGGGIMGGNLIGTVLPYLQRFDHGVRPVIDVVALPTVPNSMNLNGSGNLSELVPDYANFPTIPLAPDTEQSLRYHVQVAHLPNVSGGAANSLIVIGGMLLPGVGFVPLGLDGQNDMNGTGIVAGFTTKIAPPHGGLELGGYVVLATAVRLVAGALPSAGSARVFTGNRLPEGVDFSDGWLDSPTAAAFNSMMRTMSLPAIANANFYRVAFFNPDGAWHVYVSSSVPEIAALPIPAVPMGLVDRTASGTISVDAIELGLGANPNTVFDVSSAGPGFLDASTKGFARAIVRH